MDLDLQSFDDSLDRLRTLQSPTGSSPVNSKVPPKIMRYKKKKDYCCSDVSFQKVHVLKAWYPNGGTMNW